MKHRNSKETSKIHQLVSAEYENDLLELRLQLAGLQVHQKSGEKRKAVVVRTCSVIQEQLGALDEKRAHFLQQLNALEAQSNELLRQLKPLRNAQSATENKLSAIAEGTQSQEVERDILRQVQMNLQNEEQQIVNRLNEIQHVSDALHASSVELSREKEQLVQRFRALLRREDLLCSEIRALHEKEVLLDANLESLMSRKEIVLNHLLKFSSVEQDSEYIVVSRNVCLSTVSGDKSGTLVVSPCLLVFESTAAPGESVCIRLSDIENGVVVQESDDIHRLELTLGEYWQDVCLNRKNSSTDSNSLTFTGTAQELTRLWNGNEVQKECIKSLLCAQIMKRNHILSRSEIISVLELDQLLRMLPQRFHFGPWDAAYRLNRDGMSLQQVYRCAGKARVSILIVQDSQGADFGAFLTAPLQIHHQYCGNAESFVFCFRRGTKSEELQVFRASLENSFHLLCHRESLSIGGGSHFSIHLDERLSRGSSGPCDTYNSPVLSASPDFEVSNMEVWAIPDDDDD